MVPSVMTGSKEGSLFVSEETSNTILIRFDTISLYLFLFAKWVDWVNNAHFLIFHHL